MRRLRDQHAYRPLTGERPLEPSHDVLWWVRRVILRHSIAEARRRAPFPGQVRDRSAIGEDAHVTIPSRRDLVFDAVRADIATGEVADRHLSDERERDGFRFRRYPSVDQRA